MTTSIDQVLQKGIETAKIATIQDRDKHYEDAAKNYLAAAEYLMHAVKYGAMNAQTKTDIRKKVDTYLKRVEDIKKPDKNSSKSDKKTAVDGEGKSVKPDDEKSKDPDRDKFIQKFHGLIVSNPNVSFNDVVGLETAKGALREAVIMPIKYPHLFQGKRKAWSGILLYGPPGTGKSFLAKAIATECKSTFMSVSAADLLSKWLGESEKAVKAMFEVAREMKPCIIFVDEIDSLCSQRSDTESESSRRVKTEFLVQMQGVGNDNDGILVLAATNIPWGLDTAIRRRFEKRIYIALPGINERSMMFKNNLSGNTSHVLKESDWYELGRRSENYSGADIAVVCREALLRPIRALNTATHFKKVQNTKSSDPPYLWLNCSPGDPGAVEMRLEDVEPALVCDPPVRMADMIAALQTQRPTVGEADLLKQKKFTEEFGQEGS